MFNLIVHRECSTWEVGSNVHPRMIISEVESNVQPGKSGVMFIWEVGINVQPDHLWRMFNLGSRE